MSRLNASSYRPAGALLLAFGIAAVACADVPAAPSVDELIGRAACRDDSDCRVIGVGAHACGGPEAYRAWSVTQTDARALEAAVARDTAIRRQEIERTGLRSNCAIKPVPQVMCERTAEQVGAGRCVPASATDRGR